MPHHWVPVDPGNPTEEENVKEIEEHFGRRVKYRGKGREDGWTWMLIEGEAEEIADLRSRALLRKSDSCARTLDP